MKKLIRSALQATSTMLAGLVIFGQSAFAAPQAAVVSPTTITSGDTINVTMFCTVAGNTISTVYINPTGGTPSEVTSFYDHACAASDVTTGFVAQVTVTLTGATTATTANITYVETGSTAGGSPGTSPASNTFTVNPAITNTTKKDVNLNITTSTVATDGSSIQNNESLTHEIKITNNGTEDYIADPSKSNYFDYSVYWFQASNAQIASNPSNLKCSQVDSGYRCYLDGLTIKAGETVTFSFKNPFTTCIDESTRTISAPSTSIYADSTKYNLTVNKTGHTFSFQFAGCNFDYKNAASKEEPTNSSTSVKVPSTGYSPLVTSLMIITAGSALAGGSVLAYNKFKK